jgi:hypothetical protein
VYQSFLNLEFIREFESSGVDLVVTSAAKHNQVTSFIGSALDMMFEVMQFKDAGIVGVPSFHAPGA